MESTSQGQASLPDTTPGRSRATRVTENTGGQADMPIPLSSVEGGLRGENKTLSRSYEWNSHIFLFKGRREEGVVILKQI